MNPPITSLTFLPKIVPEPIKKLKRKQANLSLTFPQKTGQLIIKPLPVTSNDLP